MSMNIREDEKREPDPQSSTRGGGASNIISTIYRSMESTVRWVSSDKEWKTAVSELEEGSETTGLSLLDEDSNHHHASGFAIHIQLIVNHQLNIQDCSLWYGHHAGEMKRSDSSTWKLVIQTVAFRHYKMILRFDAIPNHDYLHFAVKSNSYVKWTTIAKCSISLKESRILLSKAVGIFVLGELHDPEKALSILLKRTARFGSDDIIVGLFASLRKHEICINTLKNSTLWIEKLIDSISTEGKSEQRAFMTIAAIGMIHLSTKSPWNSTNSSQWIRFIASADFPSITLLNHLPSAAYSMNTSLPSILMHEYQNGVAVLLEHNMSRTISMSWIDCVTKINNGDIAKMYFNSIRSVHMCPLDMYRTISEYEYEELVMNIRWNMYNIQFLIKILERAPSSLSRARCLSYWITLDSILDCLNRGNQIFVYALQQYVQSLNILQMIMENHHLTSISQELNNQYHMKSRDTLTLVLTDILRNLVLSEAITFVEVQKLSIEDLNKFSINPQFSDAIFVELLNSTNGTLSKLSLSYLLQTNLILFIPNQSNWILNSSKLWMDKFALHAIHKLDESTLIDIFTQSEHLLTTLIESMASVKKTKFVAIESQLSAVITDILQYVGNKYLRPIPDFIWIKATKSLANLLFPNSGNSGLENSSLQSLGCEGIQRSIQSYLSNKADAENWLKVLEYLDYRVSDDEDALIPSKQIFLKNILMEFIHSMTKLLTKNEESFQDIAPFHSLLRRLFYQNDHYTSYYLAIESPMIIQRLQWLREMVILPLLSGSINLGYYLHIVDASKQVENNWRLVTVNLALCIQLEIPENVFDDYFSRIQVFDTTNHKLEAFLNLLFACLPPSSPYLVVWTKASNEREKIAKHRLEYVINNLEQEWKEPLISLLPYANVYFEMASSKVYVSILNKCILDCHIQDENGQPSLAEYLKTAVTKAKADLQAFYYLLENVDDATLYDICSIWKETFVFAEEYEVLQSNQEKEIYRNARHALINAANIPTWKLCAGYLLKARDEMMKIVGFDHMNHEKRQDELEMFKRLSEINELDPAGAITMRAVNAMATMWTNFMDRYLTTDHSTMFGILQELSESKDLLNFIIELKDDSVVNFIDMIEEHSENAIRAETITEFDTVRRFLKLSMDCQNWSLLEWFQHIQEAGHHPSVDKIEKLASKIHTCRLQCYALRDVFNSVAKREESTKKLVKKMLASGHIFWCRTEHSHFQIVFSFESNGLTERRDRSSIEELRSRALLLVNSASKLKDVTAEEEAAFSSDKVQLEQFISLANQMLDISWLLNELILLGHFAMNITLLQTEFAITPLTLLQEHYKLLKNEWTQALIECRMKFHYMNYIFSDQIWIMYNFFSGTIAQYSQEDHHQTVECLQFLEGQYYKRSSEGEDIISAHETFSIYRRKATFLLQFIDPSKTMDELKALEGCCKEAFSSEHEGYTRNLQILAERLEQYFTKDDISADYFMVDMNTMDWNGYSTTSLKYCTYESDAQLIGTLLKVIEPQVTFLRNQLLICDEMTTTEEYITFFQRVLTHACDEESTGKIYAVLNLHALSNHNRSMVFKALAFAKANPIQSKSSHLHQKSNQLIFLIRSELTAYVEGTKQLRKETYKPMSFQEIRGIVQARAPHVTVITSMESSMGKTHRCVQLAKRCNRRLQTILVTDNITRQSLACDFDSLVAFTEIGQGSDGSELCLHLDIANPHHILEVEFALIELLYFGTSQFGTTVVHWSNKIHCLIEITDLSSRLQHMDILQYFKIEEITWTIDSLEVDMNLRSNMQIVCNYLLLLERNELHKKEVILLNEGDGLTDQVSTMLLLSAPECRRLLVKYFLKQHFVSVNILHIFLSILASQLKEFSLSGHFQLLAFDFNGNDPMHRTTIVQYLLECASEFATKSIHSVKFAQNIYIASQHQLDLDDNVFDDGKNGILRWEDNNQMMLAIADGSLTLLYRNLGDVSETIKSWIQGQHGDLPDYFTLATAQLREKLSMFCGLRQVYTGKPHYVLTPDNFLKITMILLRVQARIPVIIMGEAGCGKTSLIRFAGAITGATVKVLSIHAGTTRKHLETFLIQCIQNHASQSSQLWLFLDEINTCDELGFLNAVICQRYLAGYHIPNNVHFFAACNPYQKIKKQQANNTIGLLAAHKAHRTDHLVYRVKPLPSRMMDYIWDFGSLSTQDEYLYIEEYLANNNQNYAYSKDIVRLHAKLISTSQSFIRLKYGKSAVSMRDVRRVNILFHWFRVHKHVSKLTMETHAAIILALAHCYRCRLPDVGLRKEYDKVISEAFYKFVYISVDNISRRIQYEQEAYITAMNCGVGIAMNLSLTENVFVLLVCILNRIPVFLVGKPGSSKSLAMTLITSNLRGKDSSNSFFKRLPEVKVISFQGSESSTSDGINKIFKKAEDLVEAAKMDNQADERDSRNQVIPLVLLDEVGLAEISPYNPLKVLHAKLETEDDSLLEIAVVGISNWSLDASKMSRAIQLSRPEPNCDELFQTAVKIVTSIVQREVLQSYLEFQLRRIAEDFLTFYNAQKSSKFANFHGLRDFYSLCKQIGYNVVSSMSRADYTNSILRNFGGLPTKWETSSFQSFFPSTGNAESAKGMQMIEQNLRDPLSRYLMIITKGDSLLSAIGSFLHQAGISEYRVVIGSKFKGDDSEKYRYQMLSEIILSMEKGESLVLVDLEGIHGSLYDMSNQNFTYIAGKKHCRVALGAYSNPMAHVHDNFKCIIVVDEKKAYSLDPPFLNRFEKQLCDFTSLLSENNKRIAKKLLVWLEELCTLNAADVKIKNSFSIRDTFIGFAGEDSISSLVFSIANDESIATAEDILNIAKQKLMRLLTFPGLIRIRNSIRGIDHAEELQHLCSAAMQDLHRVNLQSYIQSAALHETSIMNNLKSVITTFSKFFDIQSNWATFIPSELNTNDVVIEKMTLIDSQRNLANIIHHFYLESNQSRLFILHCDAVEDLDKMLLTKFLIDQESASFAQKRLKIKKHAMVVLTISPELYEEDIATGFNVHFSRDWENIHIDNLEENIEHWQEVNDMVMREENFPTYLQSHHEIVKHTLAENLMSYFVMLTYRKLPTDNYLQYICDIVQSNPSLNEMLMMKVMCYLLDSTCSNATTTNEFWLLTIARNREWVYFSTSFYYTIQLYLKEQLKIPAMLSLYLLEKYAALETYAAANPVQESWQKVFLNHPKLDLKAYMAKYIQDPQQEYEIPQKYVSHRFPFSALLLESIEEEKLAFMQEMEAIHSNNKTASSVFTSFYQLIHENHLQPFFTSIDLATNALDMNDLIDDCICIFVKPHVYLQQLSPACTAVKTMLQSFLSEYLQTKNDVIMTQLMLWNLSKPLLMSTKLLLYEGLNEKVDGYIQDVNKILGSAEVLADLYLVSLEHQKADSDAKESPLYSLGNRLQIAQVIINFAQKAFPITKKQLVTYESLLSWADAIALYYPIMLALCKECQLNYLRFHATQLNDIHMVHVYQAMVPPVVNLRIMMDLTDLLASLATNLSKESSNEIMQIIHQHVELDCFATPEELLLAIMDMFHQFLEQELVSEEGASYYSFKILERYLLISTVQETAAVAMKGSFTLEAGDEFKRVVDGQLFQRKDYEIMVNVLLQYKTCPPLACYPMLTHFLEKVLTAISQGEINDNMAYFASLENFHKFESNNEVLKAFSSLFLQKGVEDTVLETAMTDVLFLMLKQFVLEDEDFENEIESHCDIFEKIIASWSSTEMGSISLLERLYGSVFLKWFLEEAHRYFFSVNDNKNVATLLQKTFLRVFDHQSWYSVHYTAIIYWLKLFRKPMMELQNLLAGEGSSFLKQYPWLHQLEWKVDGDQSLTKLMPAIDQISLDNQQQCEESWNEVFNRMAPSTERLEAWVANTDANTVMITTIVIAFKKLCRTAQPLNQSDLKQITSKFPQSADPAMLRLFNHVHHRFHDITTNDLTLKDVSILSTFISFICTSHGLIQDGIFATYLHDSNAVRNSYILGGHSDYIVHVLQHLRAGEYGYFRCRCGFVFVIDNCKQPMERRPCPNCQASLGGQEHSFDNSGQAAYQPSNQDKMGYQYLTDALNISTHSERRISPTEYRIIAFFVHCSLLGGLLLSPEEEDYSSLFNDVLVGSKSNAIEYCWSQLTNHWDVLQKILVDEGRTESLCGFMLHVSLLIKSQASQYCHLPATTMDREVLEEQIAMVIRPSLANFVDIANASVEKYAESGHVATTFERALEEQDNPSYFLGKYLRICKTPNFAELETSFINMHDAKDKYPILHKFLQFHEKLHRIQYILPIVAWTNHVRKALNFQINMDEAESQSVSKFIAKHQQALDMKLFDDFVKAWNYIYAINPIVDYNRGMFEEHENAECHEVTLPSNMSADLPLIYSCIRLKGSGREVAYLLHHLAEVQNDFLKECLPFLKAHRNSSNHTGGIVEKRLQHLTHETDEVIAYDGQSFLNEMARFMRSDLRYGHGQQIDCDWDKIEQLVIQHLIHGKVLIQSNIWKRGMLEAFRFKDALFQEQFRLFHEVRMIVPQEDCLSHLRPILHDPCVRDEQYLQHQLLPALQALLYVLQHQVKSNFLSEMTIYQFAEKYLDRTTYQIFAQLQTRHSDIVKVPLKQIEMLYEVIEDRISDTILACVDDKYYHDLTAEQCVTIENKLMKVLNSSDEAVASCFRRFIIRYLRGSKALDPTWPFSSILEIVPWPKTIDMSEKSDEDPELYDFFDTLLIGQAGSILKLLHERIQEKERIASARQSMYRQEEVSTGTTAFSMSSSSSATANATSQVSVGGEDANKARRTRIMKKMIHISSSSV